jgi:hypothetical protein
MSPPHCPTSSYTNGVSHFGGMHCGCERANATIGRVDMGTAFGGMGFRRRRLQSNAGGAPLHDEPEEAYNEEALEVAELEAIEYLLRSSDDDEDDDQAGGGEAAAKGAAPDPYWACSQKVSELCVPQHHWPMAPPGQCEACAANYTDELKAAGCTSDDIVHACSGDFMTCGEAVSQECPGQTGSTCASCAETHTAVMKRNNCTVDYLGYACSGHGGGGGIHVDIGGYWYSTQVDGECKGDAVPGDGSGCAWKVQKVLKYTEETCINARFDAAVVANKQECFDACPKPLNKTGGCYSKCVCYTIRMHSASVFFSQFPCEKEDRLPRQARNGPKESLLRVEERERSLPHCRCYEQSVMGDVTVDPPTPGAENASPCAIFILETFLYLIMLPRQARHKHRES